MRVKVNPVSEEEEVRWLAEDERRAWINLAKVLLTLPGALESQLLRDADLTLLGYMILARLSVVPGESLRMSEIAEMANGSLPRISHAVARLEDRGWVTREVCTAKRETTATPLQALVLLNDPQFIEAARVLGEKLLKQFPDDVTARAQVAFKKLIGRTPDEAETKILGQIFTEQKDLFAKDEAAAKKLIATGESKFDDQLPPADLAATTLMVNAIMNFDEFIVER